MHEPAPKPERFLATQGSDGPPLHGIGGVLPPDKEEQFGTQRRQMEKIKAKNLLSQKRKFSWQAKEIKQIPSLLQP